MNLARIATRVVHASRSRPWLVIAVILVLALASAAGAVRTLSINTDTTALFDADLPFRVAERNFDRQFPGEIELVVTVIDGPSAAKSNKAADNLAARLAANPALFASAFNPAGGPFFEKNGVLYLSTSEIDTIGAELAAAQPLLGAISNDRSARGLFRLLELAFTAAAEGEPSTAGIAPTAAQAATALDAALDGRSTAIDWAGLFTQLQSVSSPRALVIAKAKLDLTVLEQGADATAFIRAQAADLGLTAENGYRVRLTGEVPLTDEEFATIATGTTLAGALAVAGVGILMVLALGSFRLVGVTLFTLFVGFLFTLGWAAISVGEINLISIAFVFMFVGIAVDFAMQYCLHYREERLKRNSANDTEALDVAGGHMAEPLLLSAATVAIGFFCFLPTAYRGVAELGVIAGGGIIIAFLLNFTLMPALLRLTRLKPETSPVGFVRAAPFNRMLLAHRRPVMMGAAALMMVAVLALPRLVFDFDPMKLKDPHTESMSTALELMDDPLVNANTVSVLVKTREEIQTLSEKLEKLPEVGRVQTLFDLLPEDQDAKLTALADMALFLDPVVNPLSRQPAPSGADILEAARTAHVAAEEYLSSPHATEPLRAAAAQVRDALQRFISRNDPALAERVSGSLLTGFDEALAPLRAMLSAAPVRLEELPSPLRDTYVARDGRYRVQIFPKDNSRDIEAMARFTNAVRTVAPDAYGPPVVIYESGRIVTQAFATAGALALVAITAVLLLMFRRIGDVLRVLAPLLLAVTLTLGTCALIGFPLNFANIIALPLLLAVGVAYPIHFVSAWREGEALLLTSPAGRGMLFSALTDTAAFGSMSLATHEGTSSMGLLLTLALAFNLLATLIVLPAILGAPARRH
jgi:hopanoid biosynthesis associated RND transporter like protein HpnN